MLRRPPGGGYLAAPAIVSGHRFRPSRASQVALYHFQAWSERRWAIGRIFDGVPDGRALRTMTLHSVLAAILSFALRLGSIWAMDRLVADGPGAGEKVREDRESEIPLVAVK